MWRKCCLTGLWAEKQHLRFCPSPLGFKSWCTLLRSDFWDSNYGSPGTLPEERAAGQHMAWTTFSIPEHFQLKRQLGRHYSQTSLCKKEATPAAEKHREEKGIRIPERWFVETLIATKSNKLTESPCSGWALAKTYYQKEFIHSLTCGCRSISNWICRLTIKDLDLGCVF